jgi:hypothetical protein
MLLHANETAKVCIQSQVKWQEKIPRCEKLMKDGPTDERKKDTKILCRMKPLTTYYVAPGIAPVFLYLCFFFYFRKYVVV